MDRQSKLTKLANYLLTTLNLTKQVDTFISSTGVAVMPSTN
jgi:hypothetical protein